MNDLEMIKKCAEKMGFVLTLLPPDMRRTDGVVELAIATETAWGMNHTIYNPFCDDAQAMALVKKFKLTISTGLDGWSANYAATGWVSNQDLNRAICECVAKLP